MSRIKASEVEESSIFIADARRIRLPLSTDPSSASVVGKNGVGAWGGLLRLGRCSSGRRRCFTQVFPNIGEEIRNELDVSEDEEHRPVIVVNDEAERSETSE